MSAVRGLAWLAAAAFGLGIFGLDAGGSHAQTEDEIIEIFLQAGVYGGVPIASEGFEIADRVIAQYRANTPAG